MKSTQQHWTESDHKEHARVLCLLITRSRAFTAAVQRNHPRIRRATAVPFPSHGHPKPKSHISIIDKSEIGRIPGSLLQKASPPPAGARSIHDWDRSWTGPSCSPPPPPLDRNPKPSRAPTPAAWCTCRGAATKLLLITNPIPVPFPNPLLCYGRRPFVSRFFLLK